MQIEELNKALVTLTTKERELIEAYMNVYPRKQFGGKSADGVHRGIFD